MNTIQLNINAELNLIDPEAACERILEICAQAPVAEQKDRPRLNLSLVLDRSGSMHGDKLSFVKKAARHVINLLQEQDHVAIVAYDDEVNLVSPSATVTAETRREMLRRVSQLETGGSTNLSEGWLAGCREAASTAQEGMVNRALLLTDGLANAGIQDLEELAQHARELSRRGISTSTFGVGSGFNEHLLEAMSNQGGGSFYYIDNPAAIPDIFLREFKELAAITARSVELTINFPASLRLQVPGGWRTQFSEGRLRIFLGDLFSGQKQEIYIKLSIPASVFSSEMMITASVSGKDDQGQLFEDQAAFVFQSARPADVDSAPRDGAILEHFASVHLAEIANDALKLERMGEREKANRILNSAIAEDRQYVSPGEAEKYARMSERMMYGMDEADRKQSHYESYNQKRRKPQ